MKPYIVFTVVLSAAGLLALSGCAGHHRHGPGSQHSRHQRSAAHWTRLKLTPEQHVELQRLLAAAPGGWSKHSDHERLHAEFVAEFRTAKPDADKLLALIEQQTQAHRSAASNFIACAVEFHASLNPQQREELLRHLDSHQAKGERRWLR